LLTNVVMAWNTAQMCYQAMPHATEAEVERAAHVDSKRDRRDSGQ
jgi:hypothetical protein